MACSGRWTLAGLAAVAALAVGAPPAGATVVERVAYSDEYSFSYDDCGFDVNVEGTATGRFHARVGKGALDRAFFGHDNYSYTETHTNAETGASITMTGNAVFNEIRAIPLGGTLFEFEAVEGGQPVRVYDSDGNLVARDRGAIHHHAIFDVGDDHVLGGELVEELPAEVHGPHPLFDDFCGIITPLIG